MQEISKGTRTFSASFLYLSSFAQVVPLLMSFDIRPGRMAWVIRKVGVH
jgi:hypothetical protein